MEMIFHRKITSVLFVTAMLVLLVLVCMLLVSLTQLSSLNAKADVLNQKIQKAQEDQAYMEELLDYMKSNDYVRKWAEDHDRINQDDIKWLNENT